jgi:hypothetical protein
MAPAGLTAAGFAGSGFLRGTAGCGAGAGIAAWADVTGRCSKSSLPDSVDTWSDKRLISA